jgi:hypothetical protein
MINDVEPMWMNLRYCSGIALEGFGKTTTNRSQSSLFLSRDSNQIIQKQPGALSTHYGRCACWNSFNANMESLKIQYAYVELLQGRQNVKATETARRGFSAVA